MNTPTTRTIKKWITAYNPGGSMPTKKTDLLDYLKTLQIESMKNLGYQPGDDVFIDRDGFIDGPFRIAQPFDSLRPGTIPVNTDKGLEGVHPSYMTKRHD